MLIMNYELSTLTHSCKKTYATSIPFLSSPVAGNRQFRETDSLRKRDICNFGRWLEDIVYHGSICEWTPCWKVRHPSSSRRGSKDRAEMREILRKKFKDGGGMGQPARNCNATNRSYGIFAGFRHGKKRLSGTRNVLNIYIWKWSILDLSFSDPSLL